ncbi:MAG TPA: serine/threonine-protein kinase [Polyangiaceae bacterium]|jgi:serine/threonine protein kinase
MNRDVSIEDLIARSSLGTRHASSLRRRAPPAVISRVLEQTNALDARGIPTHAPHTVGRTARQVEDEYLVRTEREAQRMVAASTLFPGQFMITPVGEVGAGGLGTVDEVAVTASNASHPVGLRLARKRLGPRWRNDPGAQARFDREIDMLRTMAHPNIVSLEGVSMPGQPTWYVMPLFRRGSLRRAIAAGRRFDSLSALAHFAVKIADALAYAHSFGFIHRDIKPENILLDQNDEPVLADWGLGQFIHRHSKVLDLTRGGPMGSQYYCSLEQWSRGRCDVTGDVYSLGVVLAELALGRGVPIVPPGSGISQDVLAPTSAEARDFNTLVRCMTALFPAGRIQSMAQVSAAARHIATR